jgi:hypothetical protein
MCRKVIGLITSCLLLSWAALAAPRKADAPTDYYLATIVGDKLVYETSDGDQSWTEVLEVAEARQKDAVVLVTLREVDSPKSDPKPYRYGASAKGVYVVRKGEDVLESPEYLLRLPFNKGNTWEATRTTRDGDTATTKYSTTNEEEVEVPAGKYHCIRIESECASNGVTWTYTRWVAPRCGLVKQVMVRKDNERADSPRTIVLKSFTAGSK